MINEQMKLLLEQNLDAEVRNELQYDYYTIDELNNLYNNHKDKSNFSILYLNIRSINSNSDKLLAFLDSSNIIFNVIILSEIWSTNIDYYSKILPNYDFFILFQLIPKLGE